MNKSSEEITLELLIAKAIEFNANGIEIEYKDGMEEVCIMKGSMGFGIARIDSSSEEALALLQRIHKIKNKGTIVNINGKSYKISVKIFNSFGEKAYRIKIEEPK